MRGILAFIVSASVSMATTSCTSLAHRQVPTERHPRKEDAYTITSVIQIVNPVSPTDMNDDFQDVRVLAQDKDSCTVEVTYYPLYRPVVGENLNWRNDDVGMTNYLR